MGEREIARGIVELIVDETIKAPQPPLPGEEPMPPASGQDSPHDSGKDDTDTNAPQS
jgi:hypothetical protein